MAVYFCCQSIRRKLPVAGSVGARKKEFTHELLRLWALQVSTAQPIKAAEDAYNALTDYEKSLVDKDAKKALEDAKADLAALKKAEEESDKKNSPDTGDYANILGNIIVMMTSAMAIAFITISKKRKVRR